MIPPKVEFHNLTRHRLDFFVSTADGNTSNDHIVVTIVELPAESPQGEPEKRPS